MTKSKGLYHDDHRCCCKTHMHTTQKHTRAAAATQNKVHLPMPPPQGTLPIVPRHVVSLSRCSLSCCSVSCCFSFMLTTNVLIDLGWCFLPSQTHTHTWVHETHMWIYIQRGTQYTTLTQENLGGVNKQKRSAFWECNCVYSGQQPHAYQRYTTHTHSHPTRIPPPQPAPQPTPYIILIAR